MGRHEAEREPTPVGLESVLFILAHIHPGHEARWNEWYENDHFYAGGVLGPGVLGGSRWQAPAALRRTRFVGEGCPFPAPRDGGALALYFHTVPDGSDRFREWVGPQTGALRAAGRMFEERDLLNCDFYGLATTHRGERATDAPAHVVARRPWRGLLATLATGGRGRAAPTDLPPGSVTLEMSCLHRPLGHAAQPDLSPLAPLILFLSFLEEAPPEDEEGTAVLAHTVASGSRPFWAGGFLPIHPGDTEFLRDFGTPG